MATLSWQQVYARALGVSPKAMPTAVALLSQWQPWEGGHTKNNATWNYLNTSERMPGSRSINSSGIQAYSSLAQGAQAFAKTLLGNPNYAPLVQYLRTGQGDPSPGLEEWVSGKPTGNPGYAAKVLGHPAPTAAPTTTPTPLSSPDVTDVASPASMAAVRSQAAQGFADIAQGKATPEQTFSPLIATLKGAGTQMPQVSIPSLSQGGTKLESQAAALVRKYLGVKYTWGGTTAAGGFDCSGLVQTVWKGLGVAVPRTSQEQYKFGHPVSTLKPGDAVFFVGSDGTPDAPGHEGMYIGNGKYIAAPHTGAVVSVFDLADAKDYVGARRFA